MLRVAFIITRSGDLGGAQIHVRDLSTALKEAGHDVVVLAGENGVLADELRQQGVSFYSLRHLTRAIRPLEDLRAIFEIRDLLRRKRPDILSTHSSKAGILGRIAGRSLGIPTILTVHGWSFTEGQPAFQRWFYRIVEAAAAPLASRIITVCEWDRELAARCRVARPAEMITVHNAMPDVGERLRARAGDSPARLVMVAGFRRQKDHATLFEALAGLADLDWHLDLIGEGELRGKTEALAEALGIRPRVSFLGFRRDVPDLLARAQALLLITNWEGLPRSVLEGMRAGLPVIASDAGGVREAVVDGCTGFVVPRRDIDVLRDRLRRLVMDPGLRTRMGAAGRARYEELFMFDQLVERTLAVYEDVLRSKAGERLTASGRARGRSKDEGSFDPAGDCRQGPPR